MGQIKLEVLLFSGMVLVLAFVSVRGRWVASLDKAKLAARLAERERISRELHDTVLQGVQALLYRVGTVSRRIQEGDPTRYAIEEALEMGREVLVEGRDRLRGLRALSGPEMPLIERMDELCSKLRTASLTEVTFHTEGLPRAITDLAQQELYLLFREALLNATLHSEAKEIECVARFEASQLSISCHDNGCGLDAGVLARGWVEGHWGLLTMRERAESLSGRLTLRSESGEGTEVRVQVPGRIAYSASNTGRVQEGREFPRTSKYSSLASSAMRRLQRV